MSLPRPIRPYHFHADLIWRDGPFKYGSKFSDQLNMLNISASHLLRGGGGMMSNNTVST
jgi:hypothetical protein